MRAEKTAAAHTTFRLSAPAAHVAGTADDIAARSRQHREVLWRFQARVAKATSRAVEDVADDMRRARYLDAQEAVDYGLIDAVRA